jgi:pyrroline-5-carboxylate reductase
MIGFIGGGNMAEALIKGLTAAGTKDIVVSEPDAQKRARLENLYGVKTEAAGRVVVSSCNQIVLAVKPQVMDNVLDEFAGIALGGKTVISIAAGITLSYLSEKLGTDNVIRVMPNTPALVLSGMSAIARGRGVTPEGFGAAVKIFSAVGKTVEVLESDMDAVTALSGSGPAFAAYFVWAMVDAAVALGLTAEVATVLALQTVAGTVKLLETGRHPTELIKAVASPGGTTEAGLRVLDERGFKELVADTLNAAAKRSAELGAAKKPAAAKP